MFRRPTSSALVGSALATALCALTPNVYAQSVPSCDSLQLPKPIFGAGGSAVTATLRAVATALAGLDDPITVLYYDPGACPGYQQYLDDRITGTLKYWDAEGNQLTCTPPIAGQRADFAHMGNPHDFCAGLSLPSDYDDARYGEFLGPVQTLNLIVDRDSSQSVISAEALYYLYGLGADAAGIAPWTDPTGIVVRTTGSFVHQFLADAVFGNPGQVFFDHPSVGGGGVEVTTNGDSVNQVTTIGQSNPEAAIGYVSGSAADAARENVKTLAYQHYDQSCGYWPDSSESALDKRNVRRGQYHFWTPGHFFARLSDDGEIENPLVAQLIGWFSGELTPPEGVNVTELIIQSGDVPGCAMEVTREGVAGAISSYQPPVPCGCYFELTAGGSNDCEACESDDDCAGSAPKCRFGFCEAY